MRWDVSVPCGRVGEFLLLCVMILVHEECQ